MAIFRDGVKIGNNDIRVGLGKDRVQGLLRKAGIIQDGKGRKEFEKDARGEIQMIRTAIAQAEGFTFPVNYQLKFAPPKGIEQPTFDTTKHDGQEQPLPAGRGIPNGAWEGGGDGFVRGGGLDWKTHKMNFSDTTGIRMKYREAAKVATTLWNKNDENTKINERTEKEERIGDIRSDTTLNLFCSKVSIPENQ